MMRRTLILAALLTLLTACAAPPPASNATTAPPSPSATPTATPSPTVAATPITLPSTAQLSAPTATLVWAFVADSRLFRSTDRGDTWQDRSAALPGGPTREMAFVTDNEGWLATFGSAATQCQYQSVGIAHTTDGGAKWDQLVVPGVAPAPDASGLGGPKCKERLAFADAQRGFLSAYDPNSAPVIYRTTDGGNTWKTVFTDTGGGAPLTDLGFTDPTHGVAVLGATPDPKLLVSSDAGATWRAQVFTP